MNTPDQSNIINHLRFLVVAVLSLVLMFVDVRTKLLNNFRFYVETALYPILALADSPNSLSRLVTTQFKSHSDLIKENEELAEENYMQKADLLRLRALEAENAAMRKLLNSAEQPASKRLFSKVIDVDSNPYLKRVVVNQGTNAGVYQGMPVVTDTGLVGQVISVNYNFSRVLLITDQNCSVPVMNSRTHVRSIATGSGLDNELLINNVPRSTDIQIGDQLITSGLGGVYPEGYPVATVSSIGYSETQPFALVKAKPAVDMDKMRYVLMFFYNNVDNDQNDGVKPKQPSDGKVILRQKKIKTLIDSLSISNAPENDQAQEQNSQKEQPEHVE
ncbi:MAG: rod shape-determining protein MreC [Succinivibrio sp.]|nr:rod shape-determining protein MreC [Succinivibrio sp.]